MRDTTNGCCSGASIGDGGFTLACISGCRGVIGCIIATWLCPAREKVRPARSDGGCEREKVRPAYEKWPKIGVFWRAGRSFSRKCSWRGCAGRVFSRARSRPRAAQAGSQASAPPGIRQRRDPEGSRLSLRAVAVPPAPETQCPSLSSETAAAVASGANAQFFHQPLTVSMACVPRSDSVLWALTRPEDRRAAWKREATFSQFTRFHQALT